MLLFLNTKMKNLVIILLLPVFSYSQSYLIKKRVGRHVLKNAVHTPPEPPALTATVTSHRWDADMTFSQATDTYSNANSAAAGEMYGFKNNIRLGMFASSLLGGVTTGFADREATGLLRIDVYVGTQYWKNPNTGSNQVIPDYTGNSWTAAGEAVFADAVSGQSKSTRYPNHGQEMYDVSDGDYGFDFTTNTTGTNALDEFTGIVTTQANWYNTQVSRQPSGGSYANGQDGGEILNIPYYLGIRNSSPAANEELPYTVTLTDTAQTFYGYNGDTRLGFPDSAFTRTYFASYPSSMRWWDSWHAGGFTKQQANDYLVEQLQIALNGHGWYRDFAHWHAMRNDGTMESLDEMLDTVRSVTAGSFIWTCSNGEALEYMYARSCVDEINVIQEGDSIIIDPVFVDPFQGQTLHTFPLDIKKSALNTPVTVKIDLSGTDLAGKNIQCSYSKVVSKGSDVWLVQIPFNQATGQFDSVSIKEAEDDSDIFNTDVPVILSADIVGTTLTVTTDIPTRAVLFSATSGSADDDYAVNTRSNTLTTSHVFTVASGNDYYVGVINDFGMATLSSKINNP